VYVWVHPSTRPAPPPGHGQGYPGGPPPYGSQEYNNYYWQQQQQWQAYQQQWYQWQGGAGAQPGASQGDINSAWNPKAEAVVAQGCGWLDGRLDQEVEHKGPLDVEAANQAAVARSGELWGSLEGSGWAGGLPRDSPGRPGKEAA